jgi:hypothetical protein
MGLESVALVRWVDGIFAAAILDVRRTWMVSVNTRETTFVGRIESGEEL